MIPLFFNNQRAEFMQEPTLNLQIVKFVITFFLISR